MAKKQQPVWKESVTALLEKENTSYGTWEEDELTKACMNLMKKEDTELKEFILERAARTKLDLYVQKQLRPQGQH